MHRTHPLSLTQPLSWQAFIGATCREALEAVRAERHALPIRLGVRQHLLYWQRRTTTATLSQSSLSTSSSVSFSSFVPAVTRKLHCIVWMPRTFQLKTLTRFKSMLSAKEVMHKPSLVLNTPLDRQTVSKSGAILLSPGSAAQSPSLPSHPSQQAVLSIAMESLLPDWQVGQSNYMHSKTDSSLVYELQHLKEKTYSCTCAAWKFSGGHIAQRTCKHVREALGSEFETFRTGTVFVESASAAKKRKTAEDKLRKAALATAAAERQDVVNNTAPSSQKLQKRPNASHTGSRISEPRQVIKQVDMDQALRTSPSLRGPRGLLTAHRYEQSKLDPTDYWISEKLDGVRAYWDGHGSFWSRNQKRFIGVPAAFMKDLPASVSLDGEFWMGPDQFDQVSGLVRRTEADEEAWLGIKFMVFDIPSLGDLPFEQRLQALERYDQVGSIRVIPHYRCKSKEYLYAELDRVQAQAGEGLMLRQPCTKYESRRHKSLLKVKTFYDAEAKIVAHESGLGKYSDCTGALVCEMESGRRFSVGSGLSDDLRRNPPAIGTIITYRFQNLTKDFIPRFPTYHGVRADMDEPKDAFIPRVDASCTEQKSAGAKGENTA